MIGQVMREVNRHWPRSYENITLTFSAAASTITGEMTETYLAGQYIMIDCSVLNDDVYKIASVSVVGDDTILTVNEGLQSEVATARLFGLMPPKDFLELVTEIDTYKASGNKEGITSESIDDYSVSYGSGGGWRDTFRKRLDVYRQAFGDTEAFMYDSKRLLWGSKSVY